MWFAQQRMWTEIVPSGYTRGMQMGPETNCSRKSTVRFAGNANNISKELGPSFRR